LYSGNLGRKQGVGLLVDTAQRAQEAGSQTVYVVSGDGAKRAELERAVATRRLSNVRLLPLQDGDGFNELLNLADVHLIVQDAGAADLVMPSKLTNMLASGRPVVVTAAGGTGLAKLIQEHDLGAVVPPGDSAALHEAVEALLGDAARRARQGNNARTHAEEYLSKDRLLQPVLARLEALIGA
jgi:colanic acid biosynthesis glycosyl transferase WcaI